MLFNLTSLVNPEPSNSPPYASEENNIRSATESEITISQNIEEETPETTGKANPNFPHWDHNNISYSFDPNYPCIPTKKTAEAYQKIPRVRRAFMTLQKATEDLISFHEKENDGDITIRCHDSLDENGVVGRGSPRILTDGRILSANIDFYRNNGPECLDFPTVELHEILHAMGLAHGTERGYMTPDGYYRVGIMYAGFDGAGYKCANLTYDKTVVECLKSVYSNGQTGSPSACTDVTNLLYS